MSTTYTPVVDGVDSLQAAQLNQFIGPLEDIEDGVAFFVTEDGTSVADVYVVVPDPPAPDPLTAGYFLRMLVTNANTGASSLDVGTSDNALDVKKQGGTTLAAGDLPVGGVAELVFDGTDWELQNPATDAGGGGGGATALDDLTDVTITAAASGDLLRYNGSAWVDATPAAAGLVETSRTITAGSGLSGGGDLSANRSLAVDISGLTEEAAPANTATVMVNVAGANKKVQLGNLPAAVAGSFSGAHVYHSTTQSIADITDTILAFDSERYDTDTYHDTVTNNSRLTAPTNGYYLIGGLIRLNAGSGTPSLRQVKLLKNGATIIWKSTDEANSSDSGGASLPFATVVYLAATDYVEVQVYQDSGSSVLAAAGADYWPSFYMVKQAVSGNDLDDLGDVVITTPADNEVLAYDNGSGDWINQTAAEAGLEPALGNPASNGYVLASTTGGTRSWVAQSGGGTTPKLVSAPLFVGSSSNTNWDTVFCNTAVESELITNGMLTSSGVQNDEVTFEVLLAAGTWTLSLMHWADGNRGRYEVFFDAATPTSLSGSADYIEGYSGSDTPNTRNSITGIVIPTTAVYTLKFKMASKHGSASAYYGCIQEFALKQTA